MQALKATAAEAARKECEREKKCVTSTKCLFSNYAIVQLAFISRSGKRERSVVMEKT